MPPASVTPADDGDMSSFVWRPATVVFLDAVAYSSKIEQSAIKTRSTTRDHFCALMEIFSRHKGRVIEKAGDGIFAEFEDPNQAIRAVSQFQQHIKMISIPLPLENRILFRAGISHGDVLDEGELISGTTVNTAARLEHLAEPGAINISGEVYQRADKNFGFGFEDLGFRILKGIAAPVRVWRIVEEGELVVPSAVQMAAVYDGEDGIASDNHSIAVLNFVNQNNDPEQEFLAEGIASDIVGGLSKSKSLYIVSPRSSFNYRTEQQPLSQIARELGVRYLVEGRVRRAGNKVRVSAQLTECSKGQVVWSENYDRDADDLFEIQDDITDSIVSSIEPEFLRYEGERAARSEPRDLKHWELLMRSSWQYWRSNRKSNRAALETAEKALLMDPQDSNTHAQIAFCHMQDVWSGWSENPRFQISEALRFGQQAVNFNSNNPRAHFTLGTALTLVPRMEQAILCQRRALELNPHFSSALGELGRMLSHTGDAAGARDASLKAIARSPSDPHLSLWIRSLAIADFIEGKYEHAARFAREAASKRPDWFFHHFLLASALAKANDMNAAAEAFAEANRMKPNYVFDILKTGHPFTHKEHMDDFIEGLEMCGWEGRKKET